MIFLKTQIHGVTISLDILVLLLSICTIIRSQKAKEHVYSSKKATT